MVASARQAPPGPASHLLHLLLGEVDERDDLEAGTQKDACEVLCVALGCVELEQLSPVLLVPHQQSHFVVAGLTQVRHRLPPYGGRGEGRGGRREGEGGGEEEGGGERREGERGGRGREEEGD